MSKKWKVMLEFALQREITVFANDAYEARQLAIDEVNILYPQDCGWEVIDWEEVNE